MGFKTGLLVGLGVGYVFGAKAGRERYEELKTSWEQFVGSPRVQSVVDKGREAVETGKERGLQAVDRAAGTVKERLEGGQTATS
jgi:hypothetical protein